MTDILETAKDVMSVAMQGSELVGKAAGAANKLRELVKTTNSPEPEVLALVLDLYNQLIDAKSANLSVESRLLSLQNELRQLNKFDAQMANYELTSMPGGAVVYRLKDAEAEGEPLHYLCPKCVEDRIRMILQKNANYCDAVCPNCDAKYSFEVGQLASWV